MTRPPEHRSGEEGGHLARGPSRRLFLMGAAGVVLTAGEDQGLVQTPPSGR
jgi:hypothetical protein